MKKKAITLLIIFALILACFAILSRAVSSFSVANVGVATASTQVIKHELNAEGNIFYANEQAVFAEPDQVISTIFVKPGQVVEVGERLLKVDSGNLQSQIDLKSAELTKIDLEIKAVREVSTPADSSQSGLSVSTLYIDRRILQAELDRLIVLRDNNGVITAPFSGEITSITSSIGDVTSLAAVLIMSNNATGYLVEATIPVSNSNSALGTELVARVKFKDGTKIEGITLRSTLDEASGNTIVSGVLPESEVAYHNGSQVQLTVLLSSEEYSKCIPVEGIYSEGARYYVYVISERQGLTGEELGAQKVYVDVLDYGQVYAALDDASISKDQKVVIKSDRVIDENSRVRVVD